MFVLFDQRSLEVNLISFVYIQLTNVHTFSFGKLFKEAIRGCECEVDCSKKELADGRDGGWNWPDDGGNFWFTSDDHEGKKNPNAMDESENLESSSV